MMNWRSASQIDVSLAGKPVLVCAIAGRQRRYFATRVKMEGSHLYVESRSMKICLDDLPVSGIDELLYVRIDEIL